MAFFDKIKEGLKKSRENISGRLDNIFAAFVKVDEDFFEELEEGLILADLGVKTSGEAVEELRAAVKKGAVSDPGEIKKMLRDILVARIRTRDILTPEKRVILVIGVNGVGKTTTIGKIAGRYKQAGQKVILAAGDTFRAAAADQLEIWAERAGVPIVRHSEGADAAAVVFDAINSFKAQNADVLLCDTAGRLHNKANLMGELGKISRILERELPGVRRETLLVLDATTGQNALQQARQFKETAGVTGLVITKLDGTAKGGVVIAVSDSEDIPVCFAGVGEGMDDLIPFNPEEFVSTLINLEV
jgi:fused signal recognition particle receptor